MNLLSNFVNKHQDEVISKGKQDENNLLMAQEELGITFGQQLRNYLISYGLICFKGVEFYGIGVSEKSHLNLVKKTKKLREKFGLPSKFVVIESLDDGQYFICNDKDDVYEFGLNESPKNTYRELEKHLVMRLEKEATN